MDEHDDIYLAHKAEIEDYKAHSNWERFRCKLRGHRSPDGSVEIHTYTGMNKKETITFISHPICNRCGSKLPRTCECCGQRI